MKVKRMVKRLFAVGAGAVMLGSTVMGAMAADLSNYPDMFVKDGNFDGLLVVGANAAPVDNLAMTDIAASMKYKAPSDSKTVTVEGDNWQVGTSSKKYEMANTNASAGSITGEQIYDIETWIGKEELGALADGTYSTTGSSSSYQQYLYFDTRNDANNEIVKFAEDDDDNVADFFFVESGSNLGEYVIEFSSAPESTVQNTAGSTTTTGEVLDDFENTKLTMMGKEYDIVLARRPQARPENSIKLTLMGGSTRGSLLEGESTTMKVGSTEYEVTLVFTDTTYAKFTVNGEQTDKLQKGDTFKLADGTELGVSEILYQSYAGGVHSSDFFIGASKLELRDNVITNVLSDTAVKVGTETINGADAVIEGTDDNTTFTLSKLRVNMTAQDDYFVPVDGKLSEAILAQGDEKELLFTNNWDMEYKGLADVETHEIKLHSNTDRKYKLQWYDGDGNMVDMPFAYATSNTNISFTEESTEKDVVLNEGLNITKNDYFVVSGGSASAGTAKSFALQYKGSDKITTTSPKIQFQNLGSGETLEYSLDTDNTSATVATIKLGGYSFVATIDSQSAGASHGKDNNDATIRVDLDADGTVEDNAEVDIVDKFGMSLDFGGSLYLNKTGLWDSNNMPAPHLQNVSYATLSFQVTNTNDYDNFVPSQVNATVSPTATNEVTVSSLLIDGASQNLITPENEENIAYGYTSMGAKLTYRTPSSSPSELTIDYPKEQRLPQLYVTSGTVTTSSSSTGDLVAVTVVDATKLDSEVASVDAQNLIVVGGPCVNSVAAELMGNSADCAAGFTPGKAVVKVFEHSNGKVAMLVAGYSGADTRLAGKVIAHRWTELSGEEVEVEGTTYSDATIGAPTKVVAETTTTTDTTTTE